MGTLYIDKKYTRLEYKSHAITAYIDDAREGAVPLKLLDHLVITSSIDLPTNLLLAAADAGVMVSLIGGRYLQKTALLYGTPGVNTARRISQYKKSVNPVFCLVVAKRLIHAKINGHRRIILQMMLRQPQRRKIFKDCADKLTLHLNELENADSLAVLLGHEGSGARSFFQTLQHSLPSELQFTGRKRRPPPDPVNASLSLGYTLLHSKAVIAIRRTGLDPSIGFYHQPNYSRDSLACDLMEPLRPRVDAWVWNSFTQRQLRGSYFTIENSGCKLAKKYRGQFFAHFEKAAKPWTRAMIKSANHLVHSIESSAITGEQ